MRVLLGWGLDGPARTGRENAVRVGEPAWGPAAMLRDLELRLALPPVMNASASVRVPRYAARIRACLEPTSFHATSFAADDIGTAATLLAWRDELVLAAGAASPSTTAARASPRSPHSSTQTPSIPSPSASAIASRACSRR